MKDIFITYWGIGIIYVITWQVTMFIYIKVLGDKYIYDETPSSIISIVITQIFLTFLYPFATIALMLSVLNASQERRNMQKTLKQLADFTKNVKNKIDARENTSQEKGESTDEPH